MTTANNKLIVALDVDNAARARQLVNDLRGRVGMFKIGSQLFTAAGPQLVREIVNMGERVFLDLKFHDIPNTVAAAGVEAMRLGASIFNVHAAGGAEVMRRTAERVAEAAGKEGRKRPAIIGVTVLTSSNETMLQEIGITMDTASLVQYLAALAEASGLDGVVASPQEVGLIRARVNRDDFIIVTPGVRRAGASLNDQKRVTTPAEAVAAGADYIVVGRPIIEADDPALAAEQIVSDMNGGLAQGAR